MSPFQAEKNPAMDVPGFSRLPTEIRDDIYDLVLPDPQLIKLKFTLIEQPIRCSHAKGYWLSLTSTTIPSLLGLSREAREFVLQHYDLSNVKYGKSDIWISHSRDTFYFSANDWEEFVLEHDHIRHYLPLVPDRIRNLVVGRAPCRISRAWTPVDLERWVLKTHVPLFEAMFRVCPNLHECSLAISHHRPHKLVDPNEQFQDSRRKDGRELYLGAFKKAVDKLKETSIKKVTAIIALKLMFPQEGLLGSMATQQSTRTGCKVQYFEARVMDGITSASLSGQVQ